MMKFEKTKTNQMKKKLLISWDNHYQFNGAVVPLIPKLAENFLIYVIFIDVSTPPIFCELLESMKAKGLIKEYWLLPDFSWSFRFIEVLRHHWTIRQNMKKWKRYNFDVLLANDATLSFQRYLAECVIPNNCIHICWMPSRTRLLIQEDLASDLLNNVNASEAIARHKRAVSNKSSFLNRLRNWVTKIKEEPSLRVVLKKGMRIVQRTINVKKKYALFLDSVFFPMIFAGRVFIQNSRDRLTQTGVGTCDAMIFCDEVAAKIHTPLLGTSKIYIASYPTEGQCHCTGVDKNKSAILVVRGHGHEVQESFLPPYYRDIQTVLQKTGGKIVHLRPHPRGIGNSSALFLSRYLKDCGIEATIVENKMPIRKIACDYLAVIGSLSDSLRDARSACDYVSVACLIAICDPRYKNPRLSFGDSKMIGWIEKDGSYDPKIFGHGKYGHPKRKTVPEILSALVKND